MDSAGTPTGTVARYTWTVPLDLSIRLRKMSAEAKVNRFPDGKSLYCAGFSYKASDCVVRKLA